MGDMMNMAISGAYIGSIIHVTCEYLHNTRNLMLQM